MVAVFRLPNRVRVPMWYSNCKSDSPKPVAAAGGDAGETDSYIPLRDGEVPSAGRVHPLSSRSGVTMALIQMSMGELLANLQTKFGKDLSNYRLSCIQRRLSLRMTLLKIASLDEYMEYLCAHPGEIEQLLDTVTIHVTEFFRDPEVFDAIAKTVLPEIVSRKLRSPSRTIRVWSAGCSTGEETYSLAMLMMRQLRLGGADLALEVYGTDVSNDAVATAIEGVYDARKIEGVPEDIRRKCLRAQGTGYRVASEVRRCVGFSVHDLFSPAPYSLLDLVVCRNVLIHFDQRARDGVLKEFHAALGNSGLLVLGRSEAVAGAALDWYELVDPRNKVYRKIVLRNS